MIGVAVAAEVEHPGLLGFGCVLSPQLHVASGTVVWIVTIEASPGLVWEAADVNGVHVCERGTDVTVVAAQAHPRIKF